MPRNPVTTAEDRSNPMDWAGPDTSSTPSNPNDWRTSPGGPGGGGTPSPFPGGNETLGRPMYPWLESWGGQFEAPMTDMQNSILQHMFDTYGGGGSGSSGGSGLSFSNPYMGPAASGNADLTYVNQTKEAMQKIKDYQDQQALRRIGSSAAAGGNALSGARIGAEHDYLGQSGAQFESNIGQMMQAAQENERNRNNAINLARIGVGPQYASVSQRADEARMNNQLAGTGMLWNAAGLPQQLASHDLQGQYADWLRQIGALSDESRYPEQLALATLNQGRYSGQTPNQYGPSEAAGWASLIAALFGNGGSGGVGNSIGGQAVGGLWDLLKGLIGGSGEDPNHLYGEPVGPVYVPPRDDSSQPWNTPGADEYAPWENDPGAWDF